jgi:hypothetical protein
VLLDLPSLPPFLPLLLSLSFLFYVPFPVFFGLPLLLLFLPIFPLFYLSVSLSIILFFS